MTDNQSRLINVINSAQSLPKIIIEYRDQDGRIIRGVLLHFVNGRLMIDSLTNAVDISCVISFKII